ncbi:MAG: type VI secretion system tube protein Hcp [Candidatus Omnitrophica bacterium]|nr:type VI secretion system tube protein Hcp [Candidatus Omnitrophota bacterium]
MMRAVMFIVCLSFCASMAFDAQGAAYIKFDGVDGEAKDKNHAGWSDIQSFEHEIQRSTESTSTGLQTRGSVTLGDITVVKELDKASPKLAEACLKGAVIPVVRIHVTASYADAGQVTYFIYELKNVIVTSYSISGSGQSEEVPVEDISLNFEEIKVTYTEMDAQGMSKGNIEYQWKVEEGEL